MRIATWNVNSIKQRIDNPLAWLAERQPDIVCLQETKCVDEAFPREPFEALGYNVAVHGQKTFNGVAILSKFPFDEVTPGLPGDDGDDHARFLEAVVSTAQGALRIASLYLPNGNPPETDKYSYKIKWMDRLVCLRTRTAGSWRSRWSWPATTTSSRPPPTSTIRRPGSRTRCSCRRRASSSARLPISA